MKKTMIVLTVLLALAPAAAVSAQQEGPPVWRGQAWRQGVPPRAALARQAAVARRMAMRGRLAAVAGRGLGLRGQMWAPGAGRGFRGQAWGPGQGPGFQGGMRLQGPGAGLRGQPGPLGPLGNPRLREQLNLTDEQVRQLEELRESGRAEQEQRLERLRARLTAV